MSLKLMYITNRIDVAQIAEAAGVDRIFADMEYIGKAERQGHMDTVQNRHTIEDVRNLRAVLHTAELLVRVNPLHGAGDEYGSSEEEINEAIQAGADIIMLPYFKTVAEVKEFIRLVGGRTKVMLLFETPDSIDSMDEILELKGIDEVFIGLNDLSLGYGRKFMFELLADGTVEQICMKFKKKGLPYGFGGIASLGKGLLPSEYVISEHYKLGSTCAILSRSFCNVHKTEDIEIINNIFGKGIREIRNFEGECAAAPAEYFTDSEAEMRTRVKRIVESMM